MQFAYSTNVFRSRSLAEAVDGILKAGFCAVEIVADRPHAFPDDLTAAKLVEINEYLAARKVRACNLNSSVVTAMAEVNNPGWLEEDWKHREMRIRYTLDCLRIAAAMGVPSVSTDGGGPVPNTMDERDAWGLFVANMHRVLPLAQKLGVKILIEPGPDSLIKTGEQSLDFLKEFKFNEYLGISFDAGYFFCGGEDPCETWEKLKNHVAYIHLDDISAGRSHRRLQLGAGDLDIPAFLQCLWKSNYQGFVTVRVDAFEQRGEDIVMASARYLREKGYLPSRVEEC